MHLQKMEKLCRICTKRIKDEKLIKLFTKTQDWIAKIEEITGILLKNSKPLPQYICKICQEDLETAYDFRERCIKAQQHFNSVDFVGSKSLSENLEIKDEASQSSDECTNVEVFCTTELEIKDELPIDERNIAEFCFVKAEARNVLLEPDECPDIDSSCSSSPNDSVGNADGNIKDSKTPRKVKRLHKKHIKRPNDHKKHKVKHKKGSRRRLKTEDDSNTFMCDQCGSHFNCKSNFLTHQSRHTGDKEYHCEICPEQFFLHSELQRHVRKHTGEKPYPCRYCERRFLDYSTRFRHERTHTNERPYACTQCSKAFTSSFILKNHMVIHTGVRTFWCDLCDKWFGQKPHLVTHYKSMMHKQNEEKRQLNT